MAIDAVYADAHGNDFLLLPEAAAPTGVDRAALARDWCRRSRGGQRGADGLIFYRETPAGASMQLRNADGSYSEVSGNGVRCLAALLAVHRDVPVGGVLTIETDAGPKRLTLTDRRGPRCEFRAAMGEPRAITRFGLAVIVADDPAPIVVDVATLDMGNPQCVVLDARACTSEGLARLGGPLAVHRHFPHGTNVELLRARADGGLDILIWERGVGPTASSGTGTCAAAVAAAAFLGGARDVVVHAPGGSQRVEWLDDGVYLTGWAEAEMSRPQR